MRKKVKLADVNSGKWKVKKEDRATVSRSRSSRTIASAMEEILEQNKAQLATMQKMMEVLNAMLEKIAKL